AGSGRGRHLLRVDRTLGGGRGITRAGDQPGGTEDGERGGDRAEAEFLRHLWVSLRNAHFRRRVGMNRVSEAAFETPATALVADTEHYRYERHPGRFQARNRF